MRVPRGCDSHYELEALLRLEAGRRLLDAVIGGQWEPEPLVLEAVEELVGQAERFFALAGWTERRAAA